ncbi:TniB family NTP-binding protein [Acinetobacter pseudolwoffii]|uniref:TniB family NTP-binding protein n=1 Tax=Acinetobacter pseudolwoffii TaxID=2053287 RepID=UPI003FD6CF42
MEKFDNYFEQISSINNIVVTSDEFMTAFQGIQNCVKRSIAYKEPIGSMLLAKGGLGKTTLCKTIVSQMPKSTKIEEDHKKIIIPAFYVEVPSPATVKSLAITMLHELGDPTYNSGTTSYLTDRLSYLLSMCETKLVFLDEFHHLFERKQSYTRMNVTIGNWLKTLVNQTGISFCLVGLPEFAELLQVDSQIARRFPFIFTLNPLYIESSQGHGTIYAFLNEIARKMAQKNISFSPPLDNPLMGMQIYTATQGYHSYIISLIRESIVNALNEGRLIVNKSDFSTAWELGITDYISKPNSDPFKMSSSQLAMKVRE